MNGKVDELIIYVGGNSQETIKSFGYVVTWSPEDLIEECTRPARVVHNGVIKSFPALSGLESLSIKDMVL